MVQVIGLLRQLFLAANVGIDSSLDALFIGLGVPLAIVALISAGVSVALVPAYIETKAEQGNRAARRLVGTILVWVSLAGVLSALTLWTFAEDIVAIAGPGLADAGTAEDAERYLRGLVPLTFLAPVVAIMSATCQAERMFRPMVISSVAGPVITLVSLVYFWDSLELEGFVVGTLAGAVVSTGVLLGAVIRRQVAPLPRLVSRGLGLRALARHAAPLTLSRALLQVQGIFDRAIASLLLSGGVSALRFGDSLVRLPFSAIAPAYQAAIYPTLVQTSRDSTGAHLGTTTERLIRYALVFFVPLAALTIAVAPLATAVVYGRGSFDEADVALTAQIVALSAPLIITWTIQPTLVSALNARRKGAVLLAGGILTMTGNIALDVLFGYLFGVVGIPLATVVVSVVVVAFMGNQLKRLQPGLSWRPIWRTFGLAFVASTPSAILFGVPIWTGMVGEGLFVGTTTLAVAGLGGLVLYYGIARRIGLPEADSIIAFALNTLKRIRRGQA